MAKVIGLGGVFLKCKDPDALKQWYVDNLGMPDSDYPGISLPHADLEKDGYSVFGLFKTETEYFKPSSREFMVNLMVDDLDGALARVAAAGAELVGDIEDSEFGKFGWFMDPDGNKVELWQPPKTG